MSIDIFAELDLDLDPGWHREAACMDADPADFFPEGDDWLDMRQRSLSVCNGNKSAGIDPCPVRQECLNEAMKLEQGLNRDKRSGIFGGLTAAERVKLEKGAPAKPARPRKRIRTTCANGHEWTEENTGRDPNGVRRCVACRTEREKAAA